MKYTNSQKYMNSFASAERRSELSGSRTRQLCDALGRVQLGFRTVCLPAGGVSHAIALLLEAAIKQSGHKVGRITAAAGFDHLKSTLIGGELPAIECYCKAATALKDVASKAEKPYYAEEAVFALGLLICKLENCDVVILEGLSDRDFSLDAVCAPYDLIVMPTVYDSKGAEQLIKPLCDAIRRGTREVVSGNQKSEIYNRISTACVMDGVRLFLPMKAQTTVTERTPRKQVFYYRDKECCTLRSPSYLLCDAAMTVIEAVFSLRRGGLKLPWSQVDAAFAGLHETGCFEILSVSPDVILDMANTPEEAMLLKKTSDEVLGRRKLTACLAIEDPALLPGLLSPFGEGEVEAVILLSELSAAEITEKLPLDCPCEVYAKASDTAKAALKAAEKSGTLFCFGEPAGVRKLKDEIKRLMNQ